MKDWDQRTGGSRDWGQKTWGQRTEAKNQNKETINMINGKKYFEEIWVMETKATCRGQRNGVEVVVEKVRGASIEN